MTSSIQVLSLNVGLPQPIVYEDREVASGIYKTPAAPDARLFLSYLNLTGDGQADLVNHGGVDKAVCVYSSEHYPFWERELSRKLPWGAFGENLTVAGMLEKDIHIGDVLQLDEAVVQVSQPRGPCYKLGVRLNEPLMAARVQETGYSGFYLRVLQEGEVGARPALRLLEEHPARLTVAFVNRIKYQDKQNRAALRRILGVPELAAVWRQSFAKRLAEGENQ